LTQALAASVLTDQMDINNSYPPPHHAYYAMPNTCCFTGM